MTSIVISNGDLYAWGLNIKGNLGFGNINQVKTPTKVPIAEEVKFQAVSYTNEISIALDTNGEIWVCGYNRRGQLGAGQELYTNSFIKVTGIPRIIYVKATQSGSFLIIDEYYKVWATGNLAKVANNSLHEVFTLIADNGTIVKATANLTSLLLLDTNGLLWSLGLKHSNLSRSYIQVPSTVAFTSIDINTKESMAIDNNGKLWVYNKTGVFTPEISSENMDPLNVRFIQISMGGLYAIAVDEDGRLWSKGDNRYGQLGLGDLNSREYFTPVTLSEDVRLISIFCGNNISNALDEYRRLWVCGVNSLSQLGLHHDLEVNKFTLMPFDIPIDILPNSHSNYRYGKTKSAAYI